MGKYLMAFAFIFWVAGFAGCDNGGLCQEAQDILDNCELVDTNTTDSNHPGFLEGLISGSSCQGSSQCVSGCIVDNPDGACEFQNHDSVETQGQDGSSGEDGDKSPALKSFDHCWLGCFVEGGLPDPTAGLL